MTAEQHQFIFSPGDWLGEGQVSFSASDELLKFRTLWSVFERMDGIITLRHEVELDGVPERVVNNLEVFDLSPSEFNIVLTNDMVEKVKGKGLVEEKRIAWEFREEPGFEGFEVYELNDDGSYKVHAEYLSSDQFRTIIDGKIWKREEASN